MGKMSTDIKAKTKIEVRDDVLPPPEYKVIFVNDNTTTMDFVIEMLISVFAYDVEGANTVMLKIHEDGSAVVAVLPYEIAEQKALEVTMTARSNNFPLSVRLEPNS